MQLNKYHNNNFDLHNVLAELVNIITFRQTPKIQPEKDTHTQTYTYPY